MHVFILVLFLNASGAIDSYSLGGAESLAECHKAIEADKSQWKPGLKGLPFCIDTSTASGVNAPAVPVTKAKKSLGTEI